MDRRRAILVQDPGRVRRCRLEFYRYRGHLLHLGSGHTGGESETIIGNWLKRSGKRSKIVLATKVGMQMPAGKGLKKRYILQAVEDSLRRLQTDHIDLYQSHEDDPSTPLEETLGAFAELIKQGKVAGHRRVELQRGSARRSVAGGQAARAPVVSKPPAEIQSL